MEIEKRKKMNDINDLKKYIINYIENNKIKYNIEYSYTLATLDQLLNEIYKEYILILKSEE